MAQSHHPPSLLTRFHNLSAAFRAPAHRPELDQLLGLSLLDTLLGLDALDTALDLSGTVLARNAPLFAQRLPAAQWLRLPEEIKFQVRAEFPCHLCDNRFR